jgi:AmiR/NasT family two-component response regulator
MGKKSMGKTTILIVEDEAIVAADLSGKLGKLGYEISGTTDRGEEAIKSVRERRPDLVLMDIRLAGTLDGVETAEIIHREFNLPVIYLTAHSDRATLDRAKLTEQFGYILKPFDDLALETYIEMALYKHQAENKLRQAHDELELRVHERTKELNQAQEILKRLNDTLEMRVAERTAELDAALRRAEETSVELRREYNERKQAEEALQEEERYLRTILQTTIDGFWVIDAEGKITREIGRAHV